MYGFAVDVTALHSAAGITSRVADDLDGALARLRCDVEDVASSRWRGDAAAAFAAAWQRWDRAAGAILAELGRMAEELARTCDGYELTDAASAAELRAAP